MSFSSDAAKIVGAQNREKFTKESPKLGRYGQVVKNLEFIRIRNTKAYLSDKVHPQTVLQKNVY
jgi:hypothetical protein